MRTISTSRTLQTWFVTSNLSRTKYLESSHNWYHSYKCLLLMSPPSSMLTNAPTQSEKSQQEFKTLNITHIPSEQKTKSRKYEAWDVHMRSTITHVRVLSNLHQSTINMHQVCKMMGVCTYMKFLKSFCKP